MKRTIIVLTLVLAMLLASGAIVSAQSGTWVSGIMIQNQSTTAAANITVTFYWAEGQPLAGQVAHSFTDTIAAGQSKSYYVPTDPKTAGLPANFVGSAVVSSDQPVAANLNTQLPVGTGTTPANPNRVGTASGVLEPSNKLYFTQVMKAYYGWESYIAVQNTSATAATVTVRYYNDSNGAEVAAAAQTKTIPAYSTSIIRQSENANLPASWGGSAVATAAGAELLAGVANFFNAGTSVATASFNSYNAFGAGATKVFIPRVVKDYYGYQGGMKVQNVGTAATNVTIVYNFPGGTFTQTINALQPNAAASIYMGNPPAGMTLTGSGSAIVTSSAAPIVATANEDNRTLGVGITFNGILDGQQTQTVLFPQVAARFYGYSGGVQVQNTGVGAANVTLTYSMPGRTDIVVTDTVNENESKSWFAPNVAGMAAGFNGSVTIAANKNIVGIANMSYRQDVVPGDGWAANYGDSYLTYNGINK